MPTQLADQIAAGEVVERASSVVKELVENSLDAGAARVEVQVQQAGRRLLRVEDDGHGIEKEDLLLAVSRHATSKISEARDLEAIQSFGFRGEALPSIASVSHFSLESRALGAKEAWILGVKGGKAGGLEEGTRPAGTKVEVKDLFYNTPARLKFLKSDATEMGRIQHEVIRLALGNPKASFRLLNEGKSSVDFPAAPSLRERVGQALGLSFLADSMELNFQEGPLKVGGFAGSPRAARSNRAGQHLFINRRPVEHRLLGFSLSQAYGSLIPHGRHASAVIFLELPFDEVDVNVHPAKREVRFKDERWVLHTLEKAVRAALGAANLMVESPQVRTTPWAPSPPPVESPSLSLASPTAFAAPAPHQAASPWAPAGAPRPQRPDWPSPMAQLQKSYLLCQDSQGLVIVDQHAAHERVLYEKFLGELERGEVKSQKLLLPQRFDPGAAGAARLRAWMGTLAGLGLELSDLGDSAFYVQSIPDFLKNVQVSALLTSMLEELDGENPGDPMGEFRKELAARMACRAAVKAGDALTLESMQRIMSDLSACETPWACPHGRPPFIRLGFDELEKRFERR